MYAAIYAPEIAAKKLSFGPHAAKMEESVATSKNDISKFSKEPRRHKKPLLISR